MRVYRPIGEEFLQYTMAEPLQSHPQLTEPGRDI
jgi:hypothetical protein